MGVAVAVGVACRLASMARQYLERAISLETRLEEKYELSKMLEEVPAGR